MTLYCCRGRTHENFQQVTFCARIPHSALASSFCFWRFISFQTAVCVSESPERLFKNTDCQVLPTHENKGRPAHSQGTRLSGLHATRHHRVSNSNIVASKPALPDGIWYSEVTGSCETVHRNLWLQVGEARARVAPRTGRQWGRSPAPLPSRV